MNKNQKSPKPQVNFCAIGGMIGKKNGRAKNPETQHDFIIDLSKKRRSHEFQNSNDEGTPFIHPYKEDYQNQNPTERKFFFKTVPTTHEKQLCSYSNISSLSIEQKTRIAMLLNLNPPTPESLMYFVQQSNMKNPQIIHAMALIIEKVVSGNKNRFSFESTKTPSPVDHTFQNPQNSVASTPPQILQSSPTQFNSMAIRGRNAVLANPRPRREPTPPISSFEFNDIRYTYYAEDTLVMKKPLVLGAEAVEVTYHVPPLDTDLHVIIQCYVTGIAPSPIGWPASLRISVNGRIIKGPGICRFPVLDISCFLPECDITVSCASELQSYFLVIRPCCYRSYSQIVMGIQDSRSMPEPEIDESVSIFDPLSGDVLKYPGRGSRCRHCQCFDLKEYIKRCTLCRRWVCPICNTLCELKDLVFSHQMKQYITETPSTGLATTPDDFQYDQGPNLDDGDDDPFFNF